MNRATHVYVVWLDSRGQATTLYPTRPEEVHLRKIAVLGASFDCAVGLSDHTDGTVAAIGSVALGACTSWGSSGRTGSMLG